MYIIKTPKFIQALFPNFIWNVNSEQNEIFLTFDDGPIPEVTPWVLETLESYQAKATFFCVGDNIQKHPDIFNMVVEAGHGIGNHTFNHLAGWSTENIRYFHNIRQCARMTKTDLFRPPYGRIRPSQAQFLTRHYKIIMWDVLSGDFDQNISRDECAANVLQKAGPGSIIVFHDSLKAQRNMKYALQATLEHFSALGYVFRKIDEEVIPATGKGRQELKTA
jgi:peptidoglycan/xylan/chitin deacetylase (PgdA/CDA1 family)